MPANLTLRTLTPTLGTSKGSALTFAEMDNNLKNLDALLGIANVSVDNTPRLGGNLNGNGFTVSNVSQITATTGNLTTVNATTVVAPTGNLTTVNATTLVATTGNITTVNATTITLTGNISGNTAGFAIGYRDVPQVTASNVTLALTDAGKHFYSSTNTPYTITVPSNANVAFPIGTAITVVNQSTANITIGKQAEANVYLTGNSTSATRTVTTYGVVTLLKVATNNWFVNGNGVA